MVNEDQLNEIKKLDEVANIVYVPTHRSYIDFLMVSYILFAYNMRLPLICSADDFLQVSLLNHVLRGGGAFFIKRKENN